jgi:hypothetical protein
LSDPHGQDGAGVGFDLHSGQFNDEFTYTIADLHLEHFEGHWGQLDILSDPGVPAPVRHLGRARQGGLMDSFLHYQLRQLGPFIVSFAAQGAANYLDNQGWQRAPSLNGDIRLAEMKRLVLSGSGGLNVNFFGDSGGAPGRAGRSDRAWRRVPVRLTAGRTPPLTCAPARQWLPCGHAHRIRDR